MRLSVEIFPPKDGEARALAATFVEAGAGHVSVTYGAGGSNRERSNAATAGLAAADLPVAAHITAAGQSMAEIDAVLAHWLDAGVRRFVALRGDGDAGPGSPFTPHAEGYRSSLDLIGRIAKYGVDRISVAAYPNGHPDSRGIDTDIDFLKRKRDAGATEAVTQFFFEAESFLRFRDRCAAAGLGLDVVPGVMPVFDYAKVASFAARCGEPIPVWLAERFAALDADPCARRRTAAATAVSLCRNLAAAGVDRLHLYSCNQVDLTLDIMAALQGDALHKNKAAA